MKRTSVLTLCLLFLFVCGSVIAGRQAGGQSGWQTISAEEAHGMISALDDVIVLDVRTQPEFQRMRISGAVLIPHTEITNRAEAELPDKNAVILVYCQSGRRSALASESLARLGYTSIYDFGGINSWPFEVVGDN